MSIQITAQDLTTRLNIIAEEFSAVIDSKDAIIAEMQAKLDAVPEVVAPVVDTSAVEVLEARLEKAKVFFSEMTAKIKGLEADNERLVAEAEATNNSLPF